jgi:hypothetical protein
VKISNAKLAVVILTVPSIIVYATVAQVAIARLFGPVAAFALFPIPIAALVVIVGLIASGAQKL